MYASAEGGTISEKEVDITRRIAKVGMHVIDNYIVRIKLLDEDGGEILH